MKLFPQLALVSAIAISGNAMAMQALDDESLSAATGQEGITVTITPPVAGIVIDQIVVNDADGRTGNSLLGDAGSITLGDLAANGAATDFVLDTAGITLVIDADGVGGAGTVGPVLNVNVDLGATTITTGDIGVAVGGATVSSQATTVKVLNSMDIAFDSMSLNVQLGNEAQGAMIVVDAAVTGGLTISNFALVDAGGAVSGGEIAIGSIVITDAGSADLNIDASIDVDTTGLVITTGGTAMDVVLNDVRLGDAGQATLGDVGLYGLAMAGTTITVAGHP